MTGEVDMRIYGGAGIRAAEMGNTVEGKTMRFTRREFIKAAGGFASATALTSAIFNSTEARSDNRYNIIFIMTDQQHHAILGCAGNPMVKTPSLDKLASEGVRFSNAVCATPFCSPTRASLITGLWPHTHGITKNIQNKDVGFGDSVAAAEQILFDSGYKTHQMGKWHLGDTKDLRCYRETSAQLSQASYKRYLNEVPRDKWDRIRDGETQEGDVALAPAIVEFRRNWMSASNISEREKATQEAVIGRQLCPHEHSYWSWLTDRCIELIRKHKNDHFAITLSIGPPHAPWIVPEPFYSMYSPDKIPFPSSWNQCPDAFQHSGSARLSKALGEKGLKEYLRCYYGMVTMVDSLAGRVLKTLSEEQLEKNTLVVFLSDHGDMQAHHGLVGKSVHAYYDEIVRVPMIMRLPGRIKSGKVLNAHVNSVDIMPTLLDYAGQQVPKGIQGVSLRPLVEGQIPDDDRPGFCERGKDGTDASRMIRTTKWKYSLYGKQRRELFDLVKDPREMENLADSPSHKGIREELHRMLREHMEKTNDPALSVVPTT